MGNIISVKDPRGITVTCTQEQWENHVIQPSGHPAMADNIPVIEDTIRNPDFIFESLDSEPPLDYREVYCKVTPTATYYEEGKVTTTKVVTCTSGNSAEVITTYPAKAYRGGTGKEVYSAEDGNKL